MSEIIYSISSFKGRYPLLESVYRFSPGPTNHHARNRLRPAKSSHKLHRVKRRRLRCDCGKLAVTLLEVRVGSDPQYAIRLPLCSACLALEQSFHSGV